MRRIDIDGDDGKCIPIPADRIPYFRKEKEGYVSILDKMSKAPNYLIINSTGVEILGMLDGENNILIISNKMANKYKEVDKKIIIKDIEKMLLHLWQRGIITWKNGEFPMKNEFVKNLAVDIVLRGASDNDFFAIKRYIKKVEDNNNAVKYRSPYVESSYISDLAIRKGLFEMTSMFIIKENGLDAQKVVEGILVANVAPGISNVASIEMVYGNSEEDVLMLLNNCKDIISKMSVIDEISKLRIYVQEGDERMIKLLENSKGEWINEGDLLKEKKRMNFKSYVNFM